MATRRAAVIVDENLINHDGQTGAVKKTGLTTTIAAGAAAAATRRPALGNLVNRTDKARILNDKKVASAPNGTTENTNGTIDLKNVKARVDTHWKNEPIRKQLSRNNSIKKQPSNPSLNSLTSVPKLVRTKTIETATLKEVKLIEKSALLKRQDSTLSRRKPISGLAGASKIGSVDISKRTATRTKSNDSDASTGSSKQIQEGPAIQSRFRPPSFTASYSNGLIDGFGGLNIDDGDEENALLVCEYVNDIYAYLFQMEQKYAIRKNHLDGQIEVHPRMRTVLVDWISEVHTQYHFAQETFHITVSIIDRYLQASKNTTRKNLQLVGVAALFVASKYEELYPPEVHDFVYITDNTYTKDEILKMEKFMLKKLKFEMGAPTPIHFLRRFSKAAQADNSTHTLSKYFIELAAVDYKLSEYLPSEIAAASLFVSLCLIHSHDNKDKSVEYESLWTSVLEFYSTYNVAHLQPIVKELIAYILDAPTSKQNNVYIKYTAPKQGEMAKICEKSSHILQKILEYAFC